MIIQIGEKKVETKYDIGDIVTVYEYGRPLKIEMGKFYLDEKDENGYNLLEDRPIQYTITDIVVNCASGIYVYHLSYSNARCMFPTSSRSASDEYIIGKVKEEDVYKDPPYGSSLFEEQDD